MNRPQLVRLLAEAYAAMSPNAIEDMAASMDLPVDQLLNMLLENEQEWEAMKDLVVEAQEIKEGYPKFYEQEVTIRLVSDKPIPESSLLDLLYLHNELEDGDADGLVQVVTNNQVLNGARTVQLLKVLGSNPGLFNLDDDGNEKDYPDGSYN